MTEASPAGANFFNLSPLSTDGKYLKKGVTMLLHMVFKVAKTMAPSVIFIKEAEKVFLTDKKKVKEIGGAEACNRIKKDLLKVCSPSQSVHMIKSAHQQLVDLAWQEPLTRSRFERCATAS